MDEPAVTIGTEILDNEPAVTIGTEILDNNGTTNVSNDRPVQITVSVPDNQNTVVDSAPGTQEFQPRDNGNLQGGNTTGNPNTVVLNTAPGTQEFQPRDNGNLQTRADNIDRGARETSAYHTSGNGSQGGNTTGNSNNIDRGARENSAHRLSQMDEAHNIDRGARENSAYRTSGNGGQGANTTGNANTVTANPINFPGGKTVTSQQTEDYTIKRGDTLSEIAYDRYGDGSASSYNQIANANKDIIKDPNLIYTGDTIKIPTGEKTATYDENGRLIEEKHIDLKTGAMTTERFEYDENNDLSKVSRIDKDGNIIATFDANSEDFAKHDLYLDENGNPIAEKPDYLKPQDNTAGESDGAQANPAIDTNPASGASFGEERANAIDEQRYLRASQNEDNRQVPNISSLGSQAHSFDLGTIASSNLDQAIWWSVQTHEAIGDVVKKLDELRRKFEDLQNHFNGPAGDNKRVKSHKYLAEDHNNLGKALNVLDQFVINTNNQLCDFKDNMEP